MQILYIYILTLIWVRHFSTCVGDLQTFVLKLKELFLRYFAIFLYCDFYLCVNFCHLRSYINYSDIYVAIARKFVIWGIFSYLSLNFKFHDFQIQMSQGVGVWNAPWNIDLDELKCTKIAFSSRLPIHIYIYSAAI